MRDRAVKNPPGVAYAQRYIQRPRNAIHLKAQTDGAMALLPTSRPANPNDIGMTLHYHAAGAVFQFACGGLMPGTASRIGALVGLFAASSVHGLTINFDTAPDGGAVASGTVVNTLYASQGVTFSRTATGLSCNDGLREIYANADRPADFTISSAPNVVSTCRPPRASDISESNFGAVRADFASPASQVCIDVRTDGGPNTAVLRAYDVSASLLTSATSTAIIEVLCVTAPDIRRVEFSGAGIGFARFDDLVITFAGTAAVPVPGPSPLALLALAAALLAAGVRRARQR
jgi:hypothetical protein